MSYLVIAQDGPSPTERMRTEDFETIRDALQEHCVRFERWEASTPLAAGATQEDVLDAYRADIDRLQAEGGYQSVDVVRLAPPASPTPEEADHLAQTAAQARQKFLREHRHSEDEVRFFVEGSGLFYLHFGDTVFCLLCERGDLVSVPDNTPHWFDMGTSPAFAAIRLFTNADGWVANFTGSDIHERFISYDELVASRGQFGTARAEAAAP